MQINKSDLLSSASKLGISEKTAEDLWSMLEEKSEPEHSKFELSHLLYYFGAMIVIVALGWFAGLAWANFEGREILAIAILYLSAFLVTGSILWHKKGLKVPGGLFITMAVCMLPLAIYGLQKWTGLWVPAGSQGGYPDFFHWVKGGWFLMEAATIIGGCIALKFYRFPFLTAPIFFALWFMLMDITSLILSNEHTDLYWWITIGFGILLLITAYAMDLSIREDFAFWGYLFGLVMLWWGLTMLTFDPSQHSAQGLGYVIYLLINIILIILSVVLQRTVFLIFGALGVLEFITWIYGRYFADSIQFPVMLSLTGILIVFAGIAYQKNRQKIDGFILHLLPKNLQNWLPKPKKHKRL